MMMARRRRVIALTVAPGRRGIFRSLVLFAASIFLASCTSSPVVNVLSQRLARLTQPPPRQAEQEETGALSGVVLAGDVPLAGATVVVAEPDGAPHSATTDSAGRYRLEKLPAGLYAVAAVAPGMDEGQATGVLGWRQLMVVTPGASVAAPPLVLQRHVPLSLPMPLAQAVALQRTGDYTATSPFPPGARADVTAWQFERDGAIVDTVRVFRPPQVESGAQFPLLFIVYPSHVDGWQPVSVAFASQGAVVVAISPIGARSLDIDAHAQDGRVALYLALDGELTGGERVEKAAVLGGSFSSAVIHRLLRDAGERIESVVIVGGIANAFLGARDYNAGRLSIPPQYRDAIPALGFPNVRTLAFLRLSPVFTADRLPRTLIIHTAADEVIPIAQALELERAAKAAGVAVETYYYEDVSHYLQIGEEMSAAGAEMFWRIVEFLK